MNQKNRLTVKTPVKRFTSNGSGGGITRKHGIPVTG
jgi:hypothetical protein